MESLKNHRRKKTHFEALIHQFPRKKSGFLNLLFYHKNPVSTHFDTSFILTVQ